MNKPAPAAYFDYDDLDAETRLFIEQTTNELHGLMKRTAQQVLQIGAHLLRVKARLGHGHFEAWLQAEFAMTDRHARRFMNVAERLADVSDKMSVFPISVLYELAAPSTPDRIIEQVVAGTIDPSVGSIRAAKEAERQVHEALGQARLEHKQTQQQLLEERLVAEQEQQRLTEQVEELTQRIARLQAQVSTREDIPVTPPEMQARLDALQQQVHQVTQQRDALSKLVEELGEQAREEALKHNEGEGERRIRLNWYRITTEFRAGMLKLLAQWPSPLDTLAFEAEDWTRLSDTRALTVRLLEACTSLTEAAKDRIVDGSVYSSQPVVSQDDQEGGGARRPI